MQIKIKPEVLRTLLFLDTQSFYDVYYCEGNGSSSYRVLNNVNKMQIFDYITTHNSFRAEWEVTPVAR